MWWAAPLIGRDHELALLRGVWLKVRREGQPHLVTVLGEPGIGKSRLVAEFERRGLADATVLHGRCLPYGEVLGYWALATALKEATGVSAEDDASQARARLEALVVGALEAEGQADEAAEIARHLALLSGLDLEGDRSSAVDQRVLHSSARRFLEGLARQHPTCLLLEDIHWADHALLDLVEFVAARAVDAPLLIVGQARPELLEKRPTWGRGVRASASLHLEPLGAGDVSELAQVLCQRHALEDRLVEQVARGAGGNPLFAEELAAMLGERGASSEGTPALLKSLISARLDLLPRGEREAVQLAAVCGRVFWESALRALGASGDIAVHLEALEHKALLRAQVPSQFRGDKQYAFKHDLIRDVAYEILPRVVRRLLHARVADWIEQASGQRVEGYLDLLAHHAVQAEQPERALGYLRRAAERAGHAAAHRQEAALLGEAVSLAQRLGTGDLVPVLLAERGRAFASCGLWVEARVPMEAALAVLPPEHVEERARVLIDLSEVCFWAMDVARLHQCASEANVLAARLARDDLAAEATAWLAESAKVDGDLPVAADLYRRAIAQAGGVRSRPLAHAPLTLYLLGQVDEAVEVGRQAAEMVRGVIRGAGDTLATMYALPHLGLALAANGQYAEALDVFDEARQFGRDYEVGHFLARSIAMSAGFHLDVFDFAGAEALAVEARDLARSTSFPLTVVSAGIDLLLNFARRQQVGRAAELVGEVAEAAAQVGGWHGWLWQIRLAEARAEIALARGDCDEALRWSSTAIEASRAKSRPKYHVLGLGTRAQALGRLGRKRRAIADLRGAMELARGMGDPALLLRTASLLLAVDGDDELLAEATAAARRIASGLPDMLRGSFEAAEPVQRLTSLTAHGR